MTAAKKTAKDVGIRLLPSGRWQARYTDADGEPHRQTFNTKAEAKTWRDGQVADVKRGQHVASDNTITVAAWAEQWVNARPFRESTARRYDGMISAHVEGTTLGAMRLVNVRTSHVQEWVTSRSLILAPSTLGRVFTFLQGLFKAAIADRMIVWSPCAGVSLPEAPPVVHVLVTPEQAEALATEVPARYEVLVRLLATCGLRIGEALALRAEDVDRDRQVLRVARTLDQKAKQVGPVKRIKTSRREVPLSSHMLALLARHQLAHPPSWQYDEALRGLLFTSAHGNPLRYDSVAYKVFQPAAKRAGVPDVTPHGLRHYAGSSMLHDGVPAATVAKVLGHSLPTLLSTYAHAMPSGDDLARASMERSALIGTKTAHGALRGV